MRKGAWLLPAVILACCLAAGTAAAADHPEPPPGGEWGYEGEDAPGFSWEGKTYEVFTTDQSWEKAKAACEARGGRLFCPGSEEEFSALTDQLSRDGYDNYRFYIGSFRELNSYEYYLITDTAKSGTPLNAGNSWCSAHWLKGEPSFKDDTVGAVEHVLEIFYKADEKRWILNDVPNDLQQYMKYSSRKLAYICEYPPSDFNYGGDTGLKEQEEQGELDGAVYGAGTWYTVAFPYGPGAGLYPSPDSWSGVITRIPNGTDVYVKSISGNYGAVDYNGQSGWINLDYTAPSFSVSPGNTDARKDMGQGGSSSLAGDQIGY